MIDDGQFVPINNPGAVAQDDGPIGTNFKILATYFAGATTCFDNNADKCWECKGGNQDRQVLVLIMAEDV